MRGEEGAAAFDGSRGEQAEALGEIGIAFSRSFGRSRRGRAGLGSGEDGEARIGENAVNVIATEVLVGAKAVAQGDFALAFGRGQSRGSDRRAGQRWNV